MLSSAGRMTYMQAEDAINNVFKERTGMSMHVKAEGMKARLKEPSPEQRREIGQKVSKIDPMMQEGNLLSFNRVLSEVSSQSAKELNVPELGITIIMREEFNQMNPDKEFYDWGTERDKEIYQPQVEELKKAREADPHYPKDKPNGEIHPQTIPRLLGKAVNAGYVEAPMWKVSLRAGKHPGLISFETFKRIQDRLERGVYAPPRNDIKMDFPLR